jgi:hypothetical protein
MLKMTFDVAIALLLYFIPGYLLLAWIDFPALRGVNRFLLALATSLVIVPATFIMVGNLVHFQPGLWAWLALVLVLALGAWVLHRGKRRLPVSLAASGQEIRPARRLEQYAVVAFLALFAAVVNLPRLLMFFQGGQAMELGPWDETWHIQQLVSIARTGIPPAHYFFPSLDLGYYYGSWIYPAILGNLPFSPVSLLRAMSMHAYLQVFAFLGIIYVLLQLNIRSPWVRLAGIAFFTCMGGFDLFAKLPGVDNIEFWQRDPSWLSGGYLGMQISQFSTLYIWVPQHLAGGMVVLLLILLYRHLDMPIWLKLVCTGVLLGFCFTTSPFVFIGLCIAAGLVGAWNLGWLWQNRKIALLGIALAALVFTLIAWLPLRVYTQHGSSTIANDFRVPLLERFRGNTNANYLADKSLTLLGLPLVGGAMLIIDMGLMFILYLVWWGRRLFSGERLFRSTEDLVIGIQPLASLLIVFLITDPGSIGNISMRGMITSQILMALAGILTLDWITGLMNNAGTKRLALAYVFVCFFLAQSMSTLAELRSTSKKVLETAAWSKCGVTASLMGTYDPNYCIPKDAFRYVFWLNSNTPPDALILEEGPYSPDDSVKYRWLERARLLVPSASSSLSLIGYDNDFVLPAEWEQLIRQGGTATSVLQWYQALSFPGKGRDPVYLVTRQDTQPSSATGIPVYQDRFVKVYNLGVLGSAR